MLQSSTFFLNFEHSRRPSCKKNFSELPHGAFKPQFTDEEAMGGHMPPPAMLEVHKAVVIPTNFLSD